MEGKSVLVVEDERPLLEAVEKKLSGAGFDVVTARSVEQAESYFSEGVQIDAIWLDHYLLGEETGLDFVARLKSDPSRKKIPVFVVSNTAGPDKKQSYIKLGVAKYFTKADNRLEDIIGDIKGTLQDRGE